jgi:hypothetical protein
MQKRDEGGTHTEGGWQRIDGSLDFTVPGLQPYHADFLELLDCHAVPLQPRVGHNTRGDQALKRPVCMPPLVVLCCTSQCVGIKNILEF